jgi:hypothetical protein
MPTDAEYVYCARLGMSQAEAADHLGVSRAAVTKAKTRLGLTFAKRRRMPDFWPETTERGRYWTPYPLADFEVGDCVRTTSNPAAVAYKANITLAPMRFVSRTVDGVGYVARAA